MRADLDRLTTDGTQNAVRDALPVVETSLRENDGELVTTEGGVKIVGYRNVPGRLAATASNLYAKNLYAFLEILIDKKTKALAVNWDDDIVKATALTRDGAIVHPNFQPKSAA